MGKPAARAGHGLTLPLADVTERLAAVYRTSGVRVHVIEVAPTASRFEVIDGIRTCEIDLLKEGVGAPVILSTGPVLNRDDAVGLKVGGPVVQARWTGLPR
ncbi:hypothetical protein Ahu01nite_063190 [Winogradskya humida]|uniref:Uncharacterized protein n=1 Tax=Winogradskya humida TaxID=113566 RepID=A0ABQ3ZXH1_9ACTN|nr:hypothetical protein Ahu01nite_063190 [Actinoplanes humidus]